MKAVAIVYGWAEGPWQGKRFAREIISRGHRVINNPSEADIIVGHTLGCYLIPSRNKAQMIVLIGLPCWPGRSYIYSVGAKLAKELAYHRKNKGLAWWANKLAHNTWYILSRPQLSYYGLVRVFPRHLPDGSKTNVMLVRPRDDTFCHPEVTKLLPKAASYKIVEVDGAHDDCWFKPAEYLDLMGL